MDFFEVCRPDGVLQKSIVSLTKSLQVLRIMDYDRAAGAQEEEKEAASYP